MFLFGTCTVLMCCGLIFSSTNLDILMLLLSLGLIGSMLWLKLLRVNLLSFFSKSTFFLIRCSHLHSSKFSLPNSISIWKCMFLWWQKKLVEYKLSPCLCQDTSPIYDHLNITSHTTAVENFSIVVIEEQILASSIKEGIFIKVILEKKYCQYHLLHIWHKVLHPTHMDFKLK